MEKKIRERLMMQQSHRDQLAFKNMRRKAEKDEEEAYRKMMLDKFAEDDRIEQMNAQKRRKKQLEHRRAVEKMIEDKKRQQEAQKVKKTKPKQIPENFQFAWNNFKLSPCVSFQKCFYIPNNLCRNWKPEKKRWNRSGRLSASGSWRRRGRNF